MFGSVPWKFPGLACQLPRLLGFLSFWLSGFRPLGLPASWLPNFLACWFLAFLVSWIPGFLACLAFVASLLLRFLVSSCQEPKPQAVRAKTLNLNPRKMPRKQRSTHSAFETLAIYHHGTHKSPRLKYMSTHSKPPTLTNAEALRAEEPSRHGNPGA